MRYTTMIDLSEYPRLYRNQNVRLVYLHLCLISGYHDDDRDQVHSSIRSIAADVGLTVSAVRNALLVLRKAGLLNSANGKTTVRKWVSPVVISKRPKEPAKVGTVTEESTVGDSRPATEDEWRLQRADILRGWVEKVTKNPRSMMRSALMEAYESGELETYGIEWRPKK